MNDFISFLQSILEVTSEFLMSEPIKYFVGIFIVLGLVTIIKKLI